MVPSTGPTAARITIAASSKSIRRGAAPASARLR